jgi:hypothetical protein
MTLLTRATLAVLTGMALVLPACGGGGGGSTPGGGGGNPTATPIPSPTSTSSNAATAYTCPTSDGTSSVARTGTVSGLEASTRHGIFRAPKASATASISKIAVVYDRSALQRSASSFARTETSLGSTLIKAFDYPSLGKTIHVLNVSPAQALAAMTTLRAQSGVQSVSVAGQRRYSLSSTPRMATNTYFPGINSPPAPFYETSAANQTGQWDMHAIQLEYAFGYSNSSSHQNANAIGTHTSLLAVIDTGQDTLHPDLAANIMYQKCFITNEAGTGQSTSDFSTDPQGHGTDVTGIAAAVTNFGAQPLTDQGFAGAGGNIGIMAYRVFPTPDDNCGNSNSNDNQCGATDVDIASAIDDAVANGAKVISMSLGGTTCSPAGVDSSPVEGTAVANAISHNVIVVAASGNEDANVPDAPGCDTGVIAVGATSLDDGTANGAGGGGNANPPGTPTTPQEYVASYSNYGSPNTLNNASSWGIVAPGGDPANSEVTGTADNLHWIYNIWTSTPYMANASDNTFEGECTEDYPNSSSTTPPVDCRTLIAGTSQATPHVAGVAALICGINATYCTPTMMRTLLCTYADSIGDPHEGCGRLNAYRAVAIAVGDTDPGTFTR